MKLLRLKVLKITGPYSFNCHKLKLISQRTHYKNDDRVDLKKNCSGTVFHPGVKSLLKLKLRNFK